MRWMDGIGRDRDSASTGGRPEWPTGPSAYSTLLSAVLQGARGTLPSGFECCGRCTGASPRRSRAQSRQRSCTDESDQVPNVHSFLNPTREHAERGHPETEGAFHFEVFRSLAR